MHSCTEIYRTCLIRSPSFCIGGLRLAVRMAGSRACAHAPSPIPFATTPSLPLTELTRPIGLFTTAGCLARAQRSIDKTVQLRLSSNLSVGFCPGKHQSAHWLHCLPIHVFIYLPLLFRFAGKLRGDATETRTFGMHCTCRSIKTVLMGRGDSRFADLPNPWMARWGKTGRPEGPANQLGWLSRSA